MFPELPEGGQELGWCDDRNGQEGAHLGRGEMARIQRDEVANGFLLGCGQDGCVVGMDETPGFFHRGC